MATPKGYVVVDSSTNGTFVNEERVEGQRILARADMIRLGDEQFRFYAEVASATAAPPPPPPPPSGQAASPPQAVPPAAPGGADRLRHTVHGLEAFVPASPRPAGGGGQFASFLVRSGGLAGQRLSVKTPVVNIGRADYNDLVVPDPSVSTSHAKLQRREGVWVLTDLDSTNGTFVDGDRVQGEAPLAPGASVQFGDVQLVFEPSDDTVGVAKGGGTQMLRTPHSVAPNVPPSPASSPVPPVPPLPPPSRSAPAPAPAAPPARGAKAAPARPGARPAPKRPAAQQPPPKKGKGCGGSAAVLVVGGGALVALLHRLLA
jgi:pSer/pThr/pTyr-binding forkhead associated (FHA) protein